MNRQDSDRKARELLSQMSIDEKIYQLTGEMLFDPDTDYRDPLCGSYRNPGHFMHYKKQVAAGPREVAERINADVRESIEAQPHSIPPIENGEALHGAQWGIATAFPQPIAMASSFDPEMTERIACATGKECAAVGVRQVFAPVINVVRDCRWGRTVETFGEDVLLTADMGAAFCRGLEKNGVIATPKHFVDNYADGGRDSNYSYRSERELREVYLAPFKACFDAGAQSVMAAYNSIDGVPCTANKALLTGILRDEWGFDGFVVSDYCGVENIRTSHRMARTDAQAAAMALEAGLNVVLPFKKFDDIKAAYEQGILPEEVIDSCVLPVLRAKFNLGLFDAPYADPGKAEETVRCSAHRQLALESARECLVLLKNDGVLPLDKDKIRKIGVFGESAAKVPVGENYTGPYKFAWNAPGAPSPLEALESFLGGEAVIVTAKPGDDIEVIASECDVNIYFTSIIEGEGSDRCDITLPGRSENTEKSGDGGLIVDFAAGSSSNDQLREIKQMLSANKNSVVVLLNGAPVDMTSWVDGAGAVIEAWYPGEQGAVALTEVLFGETNPSAKLPLSIPKNAGQLPLYYSYKPSGRGYAYCNDDGKPLYCFGYGLSYTEFEISGAQVSVNENGAQIGFDIENKGSYDGTEIVQLYCGSFNCDVVRPLKELKAYKRVTVRKGEKVHSVLTVGKDAFCYLDRGMNFALHDGDHTLMLGTSSEDIKAEFTIYVRDGKILTEN